MWLRKQIAAVASGDAKGGPHGTGVQSLRRLRRPTLSAPPLDRDLRQNRHRDFLGRDGPEVEAGGRLDAIDHGRVDAYPVSFSAKISTSTGRQYADQALSQA
jgi:hypothetical protein